MVPLTESDRDKQQTVSGAPSYTTSIPAATQYQRDEQQSNVLLNLLRQSGASPHHVSVAAEIQAGAGYGGSCAPPPSSTPLPPPPPPGFFPPGLFPQAPPLSPFLPLPSPPGGGHLPFPPPPPHLQLHHPPPPGIPISNAPLGPQPTETLTLSLLEQLMKGGLRLEDSDKRDHPTALEVQNAEMEPSRELQELQEHKAGAALSTPENGSQPNRIRGRDFTQGSNQMSQREGRWVDVMERSHDGRAPLCNMDELNQGLEAIAKDLTPTEEEHAAWIAAFNAVKHFLGNEWPNSEVVLFGSAANGLSVRQNNDIDVCIQIDDLIGADAEEIAGVVQRAGDLLIKAGMTDVLALPKARVPVVKFVFPPTKTKVDVTVNNTLACINTKMLRDYCAIDSRLAKLVSIVKHWAKRRVVNDPYNGTLSSYCYVLMCIHHLQTRSPPVLPVLQGLPPTFSMTVGQWKAEYFDDIQALKGFGKENKESLAQLVWEFFEYWAWRHNYNKSVVSVRVGGILTKDEKEWTKRIGSERHLLCVEDPFVLSHDLGRTVDKQTQEVMRKEFWRAATILRDYEHPLPKLFEPYKPRFKRR